MLRETDLTLAGAMKICNANELAQQHAKTFVSVQRNKLVPQWLQCQEGHKDIPRQKISNRTTQKSLCVNDVAPNIHLNNAQHMEKSVTNAKGKITMPSNAFPKGNRAEVNVCIQWKKKLLRIHYF